jgi:hypothetical protein
VNWKLAINPLVEKIHGDLKSTGRYRRNRIGTENDITLVTKFKNVSNFLLRR